MDKATISCAYDEEAGSVVVKIVFAGEEFPLMMINPSVFDAHPWFAKAMEPIMERIVREALQAAGAKVVSARVVRPEDRN